MQPIQLREPTAQERELLKTKLAAKRLTVHKHERYRIIDEASKGRKVREIAERAIIQSLPLFPELLKTRRIPGETPGVASEPKPRTGSGAHRPEWRRSIPQGSPGRATT